MSNVELFKAANKEIMLVVEPLYGDYKGKPSNRIALALIHYGQDHKALATAKYFMDLPAAKVIFWDIWNGKFTEEVNEFKKYGGAERALKVTPTDGAGLRVSILNKSDDDKQSLFLALTRLQARQLAITVLDYLRAWEIAKAIGGPASGRQQDANAGEEIPPPFTETIGGEVIPAGLPRNDEPPF